METRSLGLTAIVLAAGGAIAGCVAAPRSAEAELEGIAAEGPELTPLELGDAGSAMFITPTEPITGTTPIFVAAPTCGALACADDELCCPSTGECFDRSCDDCCPLVTPGLDLP